MDDHIPFTMVNPDPPWPPWSMEKVIRTGRIPNKIIKALSAWFQVTKEYGIPISTEWCTGRGFHTLLGHLAYRFDPFPRFSWINILGVNWDGIIPLMHLLFYVLYVI